MSFTPQKTASISDIRAHIAGALKSWTQQTSDLTWPEGDHSMAAMDGHMATLRVINARLAVIESLSSPSIQRSLADRFDENCIQDPSEFARFADAVEQVA